MITRLAALGLLLAASAASAQDLPCSPLRLVVPYPAAARPTLRRG